MKRKILVTGGTGFIGRNIIPLLQSRYDVISPGRSDLDLLDHIAVREYLAKEWYDAVIHLANPTGLSIIDKSDGFFERTLRVFASLERCSSQYGKMIYIGSGAEYGKHRDICSITEDEFGSEIPKDEYGFARYLMSKIVENHENIVNLRLFACHGPSDPPHKLIPYVINRIRERETILLRQDVLFDYLFVEDIFHVVCHFIENRSAYNTYNLCSGMPLLISDIADIVRRHMGSDLPIAFEKSGLGFEYTGSNKRLRVEVPGWEPQAMAESIKKILL